MKKLTSYFSHVNKRQKVEECDKAVSDEVNYEQLLGTVMGISVCSYKDGGNASLTHTASAFLMRVLVITGSLDIIEDEYPIYDIANAVGKILNESETYKFLKETWKPSSDYSFPVKWEGKQSRKFKYEWLNSFNWLAYSEKRCGSFCKYCVLFGPTGAGSGSQDLHKFVKQPLTKYKKALEDFRNHQERDYHKYSVQKASEFVKLMESKDKTTVAVLLDKSKQAVIDANKRRLRPIIKTVIFCARNNLALRGHRDDGLINYEFQREELLAGKQGIFRSLLGFRLDSGDVDLKYHLENAGETSTMISKTIQNEIIESIGEVVRKDILDDVMNSKFYSILCDETTDISTKEQMSMCLRYVDLKTFSLKEDFVGFVEMQGTTGVEIKTAIVNTLNSLGLSLTNLRGQGFDGGSNMSGKFIGAKALLLNEQPLAYYTHCFSHQLNLSITKSCGVQSIRNMMGIVSSVSGFVKGSAKRMSLLENIIVNSSLEEPHKRKLKSLCPTRWVERHDSLIIFNELIRPVSELLEHMESDKDSETASKAVAFGAALRRSDFIMSLNIAVHCLAHTVKLSKFLQDPKQDLSTAKGYIMSILSKLKQMRSEVDIDFKKVFASSQATALQLGEEITLPRTCSRQAQRANVQLPAQDAEQYYKVAIHIPFLDHLISELNTRFSSANEVSHLEGLIPSNFSNHTVEEVLEAANIYYEDISASSLELSAEIGLWREHWKSAIPKDLPQSCEIALSKCNRDFFPNVAILLQIFATLPVTTASTERSFSSLRRIKTYLRSTMTEDRLNGIALAHIHKEREIDVDKVLQHFSQSKPRRMCLSNWATD